MSLVGKVAAWVRGEDYEYSHDEMGHEHEYEEPSERVMPLRTIDAPRQNRINVVPSPGRRYEEKTQIGKSAPKKVDDVAAICEYLKAGMACFINVEGVAREEAQRIVDFISGAVLALDGDIDRVSSNIILVVPEGVTISSIVQEDYKATGRLSSMFTR